MSLDRLRWLTIILPLIFVAVVQLCVMLFLEPVLGGTAGHWLAFAVIGAGVIAFSTVVFRVLAAMQQKIIRQNEELTALNAVGHAVSGTLDIQAAASHALRHVVAATGASAGEIAVEEDPANDDRPVRASEGAAQDVELLRRLSEAQAAGLPEELRVIDLREAPSGEAGEARSRGFRYYAQAPLLTRSRRFGLLSLIAPAGSYLESEGSERLLAAIGRQIATAVQGGWLFQDVLRRGKEAQALYEIGLNITSLQELRTTLRSIVDQAREMLGSETAALCLARGNGGLTLVDCSGPSEAFRRAPAQVPPFPASLSPDSPERQSQWQHPCPVLAEGYGSCHLSASLKVGRARIGELCVASRSARRFSEQHRGLLAGLADMAAIAINNAHLLERERHVAVLEERERLAQEMHDSLAQVLGYLHLKAQTAKRHLRGHAAARAEDELDEMASLAHEAYLDVREAILGLRETVSPARGIIGTIQEYLQKFGRQAGISAELIVEGESVPQFPPEAEVQLVRVIQEALTNVRKHAGADRAWIRITSRENEIGISIEDKGRGFDPAILSEESPQFGVRTMRERVERVGGRFEIESGPGEGTKVRIYLPLAEGEGDDGDPDPAGG